MADDRETPPHDAHADSESTRKSLVAAARTGHEDAFARLVDATEGDVRRALRAFGVGDTDLDDLVVETYVAAWRNLHELRDPDALSAWLGTIARRCAVHFLKVRRKERDALSEFGRRSHVKRLATEHVDPRRPSVDELRRILDELPRDQRELVELQFGRGLSLDELATKTSRTWHEVVYALTVVRDRIRRTWEREHRQRRD
ncbi:MAG: sigma-70 family RNA polymerase sigma factor [Planctomycetes bacterium]|nr:sigma-70 family RNA polymerase sigma factor [Planctomycetota bacterium]